MLPVQCSYCKKTYYRSVRRVNEANKFGWKQYCTLICQINAKRTQKQLTCARHGCKIKFFRTPAEIRSVNLSYCSRRCAAIENNQKYPRPNKKPPKYCVLCKRGLKYGKKYCSPKCQNVGAMKNSQILLSEIVEFCHKNGRIPLKREWHHSHAIRRAFGTWNNAIIKAGFNPNPVMFAKRHMAKDGHMCDSLAEKIIDDWLYKRRISHLRYVHYPIKKTLSVDFVVGKYWIEFFGLYGEHKRYDELRKEKLKIAKKKKINLIEIYPKHLFTKGQLDSILSPLTSR